MWLSNFKLKSKGDSSKKGIQVILQKRLRNCGKDFGKRGDVIYVKKGFFSNYLLPNGYAIFYSHEDLKKIQESMKNLDVKNLNKNFDEEFVKINNQLILFERAAAFGASKDEISAKVLFGSVTKKDIAKEILNLFSINVDINKIHMDHIKTTGIYFCEIEFGEEKIAKINIVVENSIESAKILWKIKGKNE